VAIQRAKPNKIKQLGNPPCCKIYVCPNPKQVSPGSNVRFIDRKSLHEIGAIPFLIEAKSRVMLRKDFA
jgi:hypothetical protein